MTVSINNKILKAHPQNSIRSPIYQGISDNNIIAYFKELTKISKLPAPKVISGKNALDGSRAQVWSVKPTEGPLAGSTVNLRNFSRSQQDTLVRYTIEL